MRRHGAEILAAVVLAVCPACQSYSAEAGEQAPAPDFQEVYDLIRQHLAGVTESDLNRTAVTALVSALNPRVRLEASGNPPLEMVGGPLVKASNVFDGQIAYLRIARVEDGLSKAVREACQSLSTNKLQGLVLDLRFVGGNDYAEAADTADLFLAKEKALLNWGSGVVRSRDKSDAISLPVAVLINARTARAAEALAAVLRESGAGLLLGNPTAGEALVAQEYPLKNGQRLRIATAAVQVGESTLLSAQGVKPDIQVQVSPADEREYYADAYRELSKTNLAAGSTVATNQPNGTNRLRRPRFNEAELVRERREGLSNELDSASSRADGEVEKPAVRDPALARALDVLKGLAVVRQSQSRS